MVLPFLFQSFSVLKKRIPLSFDFQNPLRPLLKKEKANFLTSNTLGDIEHSRISQP